MKKNIWEKIEADNYFMRNAKSFNKAKKDNDKIIFLLKLYSIKPKKVIEIGAVNGFRLNFIYELFRSKVVAVEPSIKAIKNGQKKYPHIEFIHSTCEKIKIKKKFDLVIVNFVFHWIYRENLLTCVKKIDDLVKKRGYLVIGDFGTSSFIKRNYHHLKKGDFFTWKMPYWKLFTQTGNYLELAKLRYSFTSKKLTPKIDTNKMGTTVLLKKQTDYLFVA